MVRHRTKRLGAKRQLGLRDLTVGTKPPLGPHPFQPLTPFWQEPRPMRRLRRCLLKDCEHWFLPTCPQARYCNPACSSAAQRWRRVQASRRYRASPAGRLQRRHDNRLYRQRRRDRHLAAAPQREGKRPVVSEPIFAERMCARPGCYAVFAVLHEHACRRFCSVACRLALRRVLDREARYRQRRRRWRRERLSRRCPPPDTS